MEMMLQPGNLLRHHGLKLVTSSLEKKELALKAEKEKESAENLDKEANAAEAPQGEEADGGDEENRISSTAYHIAASAASYFHSQAKIILSFKSKQDGNGVEDMMNGDMASMTAVVAAEEEVKQAVADDLNSTLTSPCEWFICDDDRTATRFFVIQVELLIKLHFKQLCLFSCLEVSLSHICFDKCLSC